MADISSLKENILLFNTYTRQSKVKQVCFFSLIFFDFIVSLPSLILSYTVYNVIYIDIRIYAVWPDDYMVYFTYFCSTFLLKKEKKSEENMKFYSYQSLIIGGHCIAHKYAHVY